MHRAAGAKFRGITREDSRAVFAREITEVHLSDLSDGEVPLANARQSYLWLATKNRQPWSTKRFDWKRYRLIDRIVRRR